MRKLLLILAASATLASCSQSSTPVAEDATATPAAPPPSTEVATAPVPPSDSELQKATTAAQESDVAAATAGDTTLERVAAMPQGTQLPAGRWTAGTHYRPLVPAQATTAAAGEVEVIEFLWLACGACYQLNERVEAWKAKLPPWVKFRQEHVMWGPAHRSLGRLLYTLEALKRGDLVKAAFEELHQRGRNLVAASDAKTLELQLAFAKANGIAEADFRREYNSFAMSTRLQRAEELTRRYRVDHTPVFIINGKYQTDTNMAGSSANLMTLLDDLAAAEKR